MVKLPGEPGQGWETTVVPADQPESVDLTPKVVETFTRQPEQAPPQQTQPEPAPQPQQTPNEFMVTVPGAQQEPPPAPTIDDVERKFLELGGRAPVYTPLMQDFGETVSAKLTSDELKKKADALAAQNKSRARSLMTPDGSLPELFKTPNIVAPPEQENDRTIFDRFRAGRDAMQGWVDALPGGRYGPLGAIPNVLLMPFGDMSKEDQESWKKDNLSAAKRQLERVTQRSAITEKQIEEFKKQHPNRPVPRTLTDRLKKEQEAIARARPKLEQDVREAEQILAGKRPGAVLPMWAQMAQAINRGAVGSLPGIIQGLGITQAYVTKAPIFGIDYVAGTDIDGAVKKWTGFSITDPVNGPLVQLGRVLDEKVRQMYPTDPARQKEFSTALGQGIGSALWFYGPGALNSLAAKAAQLTPKQLMAIVGGFGFTMGQAELAKKMESAARAGKEVTHLDYFLGTMMGGVLGLTDMVALRGGHGGWAYSAGGRTVQMRENVLSRIFKQMAEEGGQEAFQELGGNVTERLLYDPTKNIWEGVPQAGAVGALVGAKMQTVREAAEAPGRIARESLLAEMNRAQEPTAPGAQAPIDLKEIIRAPLPPPKPARTAAEIPTETIKTTPKADLGTPASVRLESGAVVPTQIAIVELADIALPAGDIAPRASLADSVVAYRAANTRPEAFLPQTATSQVPVISPDGTDRTEISKVLRELYTNPAHAERAAAYQALLGPEAANMQHPVAVRVLEDGAIAEPVASVIPYQDATAAPQAQAQDGLTEADVVDAVAQDLAPEVAAAAEEIAGVTPTARQRAAYRNHLATNAPLNDARKAIEAATQEDLTPEQMDALEEEALRDGLLEMRGNRLRRSAATTELPFTELPAPVIDAPVEQVDLGIASTIYDLEDNYNVLIEPQVYDRAVEIEARFGDLEALRDYVEPLVDSRDLRRSEKIALGMLVGNVPIGRRQNITGREAMLSILDRAAGLTETVRRNRRNAAPPARQRTAEPIRTEVAADPFPNVGRFTDRVLSPYDIQFYVDAWTFVRGARSEGKPLGLTAALQQLGGVVDEGGDVKAILGAANQRPGLINQKGLTLDDAALQLWENGYFADRTERPTVNDLLDALRADLAGDSVLTRAGQETADRLADAERYVQDARDDGIDLEQFKSEAQLREYLGDTQQAIDDSDGANPEDIPFAVGRNFADAIAALERGEEFRVDSDTVDLHLQDVVAAQDEIGGLAHAASSYVLTRVVPTGAKPNGMKMGMYYFVSPYGETTKIPAPLSRLLQTRAWSWRGATFHLPKRFGDGFDALRVRGELRHELVHAFFSILREGVQGRSHFRHPLGIDGVRDLFARLSTHAESLGVLDLTARQIDEAMSNPGFENASPQSMRALYDSFYGDYVRDGLITEDVKAHSVREESIAYMLELMEHGHYTTDVELAAVKNDIDKLFGAATPEVNDLVDFDSISDDQLRALMKGQNLFALSGGNRVQTITTLYRGEPPNATGGLGVHYTRSYARARGFAGPNGKVFAVDVPLMRMGELRPSRDPFNFVVPEDLRSNRYIVDQQPALYALAPDGTPRLQALHNLSAENLAFADRIGGLAAPSVAVMPEGQQMDEGFGEITLIGTRPIGDPQQNPVFDSDAYTVRFPKAEYKAAKVKPADKFIALLQPYAIKFNDTGSTSQAWDNLVNTPDPERNIDLLLRSDAAIAAFLDTKGIAVAPVMRDATSSMGSPWVATQSFQDYVAKNGWDTNNWNQKTEEEKRAMSDAARAAIAEYALTQDPEGSFDLVGALSNRLFDENGVIFFGPADRLNMDMNKVGKQEVDGRATTTLLKQQLQPYEAEFKSWLEDQILPLHGEPRLTLGRKKVPYTLENITAFMTRPRRAQGQEDTMFFGEGAARAAGATRFKNLEKMRTEAGQKIKTGPELEAAREEAKAALESWRNAVVPYYRYYDATRVGSTFDALDDSMRALSSWMGSRSQGEASLAQALRRVDFIDVPADIVAQGVEAGKLFAQAPVPYFESKPQRPVSLSEFAGAVIPTSASEETRALLDRNGIPYREYENNARGAQGTAAAAFAQELGQTVPDVLFALAPEAAANRIPANDIDPLGFFSGLERAARSLKQNKGTPEQLLKAMNAKKAEVQATGLDTFLDGKASVTKQEIIDYLEANRIDVREVVYLSVEARDAKLRRAQTEAYDAVDRGEPGALERLQQITNDLSRVAGNDDRTRWSAYSLDPNNPTYRETVLHLPSKATAATKAEDNRVLELQRQLAGALEDAQQTGDYGLVDMLQERLDQQQERLGYLNPEGPEQRALGSVAPEDFRSGHWNEPNVLAHLRTSIQTDAQGRRILVLNELQSDWGQKLRDAGGARDEAKIAELKADVDALTKEYETLALGVDYDFYGIIESNLLYVPRNDISPRARIIIEKLEKYGGAEKFERYNKVRNDLELKSAELRTATAAVSGHPLVNTTDTWVNLALKRFIRQAVDEGVDAVAIASGDTVDSFGMGAPVEGLRYAYDKMYPKNLRNILKKIDPAAATAETIDTLISSETSAFDLVKAARADTPLDEIQASEVGRGFTVFPLTDKVRSELTDVGQMMFAITAYHGSPHDFERFDMSRIGTGEGAQAYGAGLYFAEEPTVARNYRSRLAGNDKFFIGGREASGIERDAARHIYEAGSKAKALAQIDPENAFAAPIRAAIEQMPDVQIIKESQGRLYTVSIDANPEDFLDWDKPLSAQSKKVQDAVGYKGGAGKYTGDENDLEALVAWADKADLRTGEQVIREFYRKAGSTWLEPNKTAEQIVSQRLREAGIVGVRYLDQGSREAGTGSYNYVVFDDTLITITEKDGKPITGEQKDLVVRDIRNSAFRRAGSYPLSDDFIANRAKFEEDLVRYTQRMLPPDVAVRVSDVVYASRGDGKTVDRLGGLYTYDDKLLEISLEWGAATAVATARHEAVHAARHYNLFSDTEWSALVERAKKLGADDKIMHIDTRSGQPVKSLPVYQSEIERIARAKNLPEADVARFVEEGLNQERVAWLAEQHVTAKAKFGRTIGGLIDRIVSFLEAMTSAVHGLGFVSARDVFNKMESGRLAARSKIDLPRTPAWQAAIEEGFTPYMPGGGRAFSDTGTVYQRETSDGGIVRTYRDANGAFAVVGQTQSGTFTLRSFASENPALLSDLLDQVEADLGQRLAPDGWLTQDRLDYWAGIDPLLVEHHQDGGALFHGLWAAPDSLDGTLDVLNEVSRTTDDMALRSRSTRQVQELRALKSGLPSHITSAAASIRASQLDLSAEARRKRAEEQGFDTSKVWYHGSPNANIKAFKEVIHLGTSAAANARLGDIANMPNQSRPEGMTSSDEARNSIYPVYVKRGRYYRMPDLEDWAESDLAVELEPKLTNNEFEAMMNGELSPIEWLKEFGYDGIRYLNAFEDPGSESIIVFDPTNIRSVNADFAPDATDSPLLMAALNGNASLPPKKPMAPPPAGQQPGGSTLARGLSDLVQQFNDAVTGPVRQGRLNRKGKVRGGQYDPSSGVTRIGIPLDFVTLTHQGGYKLDTDPTPRRYRDANGQEQTTTLRDIIAGLKTKYAEDLILPPAPDRKLQDFPETGYTGVDLDTNSIQQVMNHIRAKADLKRYGGADRSTREWYQESIDTTRGVLARRFGASAADQIIADAEKTGLTGDALRQHLNTRFSPDGDPQPSERLRFGDEQLTDAWARWFQAYMVDPKAAQDMVPNLHAEFVQELDGKAPDLLRTLEDIQQGYQDLIAAAPKDAFLTRIKSSVRPGSLAEFRRYMKEFGVGTAFADYARYWNYMLQKHTFDRMHPMKVIVRHLMDSAIENAGVTLTKEQKAAIKAAYDPYKLWRLSEHSRGHATAVLQNGVIFSDDVDSTGPSFVDALTTALGGNGRAQWSDEALANFGGYLAARRLVAEFARYEAGELENAPDILFQKDQLQQIVSELEAANPNFVQGAEQLYAFNQNVLRWKFENGFLSEKDFETYSARADYAPLNRVMDNKGLAGALSAGATGNNKSKIIHQFMGSTRDIINPIESIATDVYRTQARVELNGVIRALVGLAKAAGPAGGAIAEVLPRTDTRAMNIDARDTIKAIAKQNGLTDSQYDSLMDEIDATFDEGASAVIFQHVPTQPQQGEHIIYYWEDGKAIPVLLGAENQVARDLFEQMVMVGQQTQEHLLSRVGVGFAGILRFGVTKSPVYAATNFLRDQIATGILSQNYSPFVTGAVGAKSVIANDEWSRRYNAFAAQMGGIDQNITSETQVNRNVKALKNMGHWGTHHEGVAGRTWGVYSRSIELAEAATRVGHYRAAYERAINDGMTPREAAIEAAYSTHDFMDFSRRGASIGRVARYIPFLNAALQGLSAAARTMSGERNAFTKKSPDGRVKTYQDLMTPYLKATEGLPLSIAEKEKLPLSASVWVKMITVGAIGLLLEMAYDDDEEYGAFSDQMTATHWFFKIGGVWWRYPKPFELAFFSNAFEAMYRGFIKGDQRAGMKFASSLYNTMAPPAELQLGRVYMEYKTGKNTFFNKDIIDTRLKGLTPEDQYTAYTSELSKAIAQGLAAIDRNTEWKPFKVSHSPMVIDHLIHGMLATTGRSLTAMSNYALPKFNELTGNAMPWIRQTPAANLSFEDYAAISRITRRPSRGSLQGEYFWKQMSDESGEFIIAAKTYASRLKQSLVEGPLGRAQARRAKEWIDSLDPERKAYAILETHFVDPRSAEKTQDVHPLNRVKQLGSVFSALRREMMSDIGIIVEKTNKKLQPRTAIETTPEQERKINEILSDINMREQHNALRMVGIKGWQHKKKMQTEDLYKELKAVSEPVYDELMARMKKKSGGPKIYTEAAVEKYWPLMRDALLAGDEQEAKRLGRLAYSESRQ